MVEADLKKNMEYRFLGNTGMKVSVLSYGNWLNSDKDEDVQVTIDAVKKCHDYGVNFFDTAEIYGAGKAEIAMGKALKALNVDRKDIVVSTKIFKCGDGPNDVGMSRKHIIEGLTNSLKRMELEYVDVVFSHRPFRDVPMEETLRAFDHLINTGKAHYWGTSEWEADLVTRAIEMCERLGLHKPIVEQPQYSMLHRENFEKSQRRVFSDYGYGSTIWSPLASGILTGKYNSGEIPEGSRFDKHKYLDFVWQKNFGEGKKEKTLEKLNKLADLAKEFGYTQAQLALAWAIANKDVSTCLLGFTKLAQVDENMKALELYKVWDAEKEKKVREVLGNDPEPDMDWRTWQPMQNRRDIHISK